MDSPPSFPADTEIKFHLLPKQPFGTDADGGRTVVRASAGTMHFNLNSGNHSFQSKNPLDPLEVRIEEGSRVVELKGDVLTIYQKFETLKELQEFVTSIYFGLPILLNLEFADPPHVERVVGNIGGIPFRWELSEWRFPLTTTTQSEQEQHFIDTWLRFDVISNQESQVDRRTPLFSYRVPARSNF